jgi:diacylglycerol kinase family enzyme
MAVSGQDERLAEHRSSKSHMALVANGRAGALLGQQEGAGSLEDLLREQASRVDVVAEQAGTLPERMQAAIGTGAQIVVVAGGDGSIACAASALAGKDTALGLIPCGTMNLLARDLGLDPADHAQAVRSLGEGRIRAIDAGCVAAGGEDHLFLCASMLGTPARLSKHREAGREHGGGLLAWAGFGRAVVQALWRNRSLRLTLHVNGRVLQRRTPSLTIVVNKLDDSSGRLFGRKSLDGGVLAIYIVPRASVWRQAWLLLRTALRGRLDAAEIEVIETREVQIETNRTAMHVLVDGELRLMKPPLHYSIRPGALRVMAPAPDDAV